MQVHLGEKFEVIIQNVFLLWMSVEVNHSNLVFNSLVVSMLYIFVHCFMFKGRFPKVVLIYSASFILFCFVFNLGKNMATRFIFFL